jgi:hypothetical protein
MTPEKANEMNEERALESGNKPAFPSETNTHFHHGLTKREYIATQLLSAAVAKDSIGTVHHYIPDVIRATDLLLIELSKKNKKN